MIGKFTPPRLYPYPHTWVPPERKEEYGPIWCDGLERREHPVLCFRFDEFDDNVPITTLNRIVEHGVPPQLPLKGGHVHPCFWASTLECIVITSNATTLANLWSPHRNRIRDVSTIESRIVESGGALFNLWDTALDGKPRHPDHVPGLFCRSCAAYPALQLSDWFTPTGGGGVGRVPQEEVDDREAFVPWYREDVAKPWNRAKRLRQRELDGEFRQQRPRVHGPGPDGAGGGELLVPAAASPAASRDGDASSAAVGAQEQDRAAQEVAEAPAEEAPPSPAEA
jgi:hypothetical protein